MSLPGRSESPRPPHSHLAKIRQRILLAPHLDTVDIVSAGPVGSPRQKWPPPAVVAARASQRLRRRHVRRRLRTRPLQFGSAPPKLKSFSPASWTRKLPNAVRAPLPSRSTRLTSRKSTNLPACRVVTAHKGNLWLKLETRASPPTAPSPNSDHNAVHEIARIVNLAEDRLRRANPPTPPSASATRHHQRRHHRRRRSRCQNIVPSRMLHHH